MSDDDDTPTGRRRPRLDGLTSAERRKMLARVPVGDIGEVTSPIDMLARGLSDSEAEIIRRSRYAADDPVPMREFVKALDRLNQLVREERSNNRERADQLLELLNRPPDEKTAKLRDEVRDITRDLKLFKWAAGVAFATALGSLASVVTRIWDRAEREGETSIRLQHIESAIERLQDRPRLPTRDNP
jgi:hypothetical protein